MMNVEDKFLISALICGLIMGFTIGFIYCDQTTKTRTSYITNTKTIDKIVEKIVPPKNVDSIEIDTRDLWGQEKDSWKEKLGLDWHEDLPDKIYVTEAVWEEEK